MATLPPPQKDDTWEEWGLGELVENLRRYVHRKKSLDTKRKTKGKQKILNTVFDTSSYIQHPDCSRLPKDTNYRTINSGVILTDIQAGSFTDGNLQQKVSKKSNSFSRLAKKSLRSCAHSETQGKQRTRRFMKIFFSCSRKHRRGTTKRNCLEKIIFRFLKTRTHPYLDSAAQEERQREQENYRSTTRSCRNKDRWNHGAVITHPTGEVLHYTPLMAVIR